MAVTSTEIVNEALALIGYDGQPVTGVAPNFDNSTPGQVSQRVYASTIAAVTRIQAWPFTRTSALLTLSGNLAPFPWAKEYLYPAACVDLWQITPSALTDTNNPTPIEWARGVAVVSSVQSSVIWTNLATARAVFNGNPLESTWDSLFRASAADYLASRFANALLGKPDMAQQYLDLWPRLVEAGATRTDQ